MHDVPRVALAFFGLYVLVMVLGLLVWSGVVAGRTGLIVLAAAALVAFALRAARRTRRDPTDA